MCKTCIVSAGSLLHGMAHQDGLTLAGAAFRPKPSLGSDWKRLLA